MSSQDKLVIVAKSFWLPAIRREHALARLAGAGGHDVTFIERPHDLRAVRSDGLRSWLGGFRARDGELRGPGVSVVERSTLLPPHRHHLPEALDARLLRRRIRAVAGIENSTVVAMLPWHWPAVRKLRARRRILDVSDDWAALIPGRARRIHELYEQAIAEADAVVLVSDALRQEFTGHATLVIRNGVEDDLVSRTRTGPPQARRLVYVGSLSERFDAPLVGRLLDALSGWTLELYGPCVYAGRGDRPADELTSLLGRPDRRAAWGGVVPRSAVADVLDSADVLLLPNRDRWSRGQDSMKIYDYAARGRPVVATDAALVGVSELPPNLYSSGTIEGLIACVEAATREPAQRAAERVEWASRNTWQARWPEWSRALFGAGPRCG